MSNRSNESPAHRTSSDGTRDSRTPKTNKESRNSLERETFGFTDRLLMIAAAVQILVPILGAIVGAVLVAWLLFRLFFG